jgi:hypothetical protein
MEVQRSIALVALTVWFGVSMWEAARSKEPLLLGIDAGLNVERIERRLGVADAIEKNVVSQGFQWLLGSPTH